MEETPALFDNYYVRAFKQLHYGTKDTFENRLTIKFRKSPASELKKIGKIRIKGT